jgi:hypothetical protein
LTRTEACVCAAEESSLKQTTFAKRKLQLPSSPGCSGGSPEAECLRRGRRRADNRRVLATRLTLKLARGMFFVSAGFGVLLGGGIILVAATAGVCAAAVVTL